MISHDLLPPSPSPYAYENGAVMICPECAHEWVPLTNADHSETKIIRDANGAELKDGDSVTVIKDLKFRGGVVKVGTKVKGIRLLPLCFNGAQPRVFQTLGAANHDHQNRR